MNDTERRFLDLSGQMEAKETGVGETDSLKQLASEMGAIPRLGIRTIIDALADAAFSDHKLLPDEFMKEFMRKEIAELLVEMFIQKLPSKTGEQGRLQTEQLRAEVEQSISRIAGKVTGEEAIDELLQKYIPDDRQREGLKRAAEMKGMDAKSIREWLEPFLAEYSSDPVELREELQEFLEHYASDSGKSLFQFIKALEKIYPNVDFRKLFEGHPELRNNLVHEINNAAYVIAGQKYESLYQSNRRNFILDYLFKRVIFVEEDSDFTIHKECLEPLIEFLDDKEYPLEELFTLVYSELLKMSGLRERVSGTRASIRSAAMVLRNSPLLDKGLDFDQIWKDNFEPVIKDIRARRLKKGRIRIVDVTMLNPRKMAEVVKPEEARQPFKEKVEAAEGSTESEIREYRRYLNYIENGREGGPKDIEMHGSNIAYLSDEKLMKTLSKQLRKVQRFLSYMMEAGLRMRPDRDQLEDSLSIPEPILTCERVLDLWKWVAHPEKFKEEYPAYAHLSDDVISHFAGKIHELLLLYRKFSFRDEFKNSKKNRKVLEKYMEHHLNMREKEQVNIRFRVREWVSGPNGEPEMVRNRRGKFAKFQEAVTDEKKLASLPGDPDEECIIKDPDTDCWFRYFPMEEKKFERVTMDVANGKDAPVVTRTYYIYSGDGNLMHRKRLNSYLSSCIRGKKSSDILRWAVVSDNAEDCDAFKNWLYDNYSTGNFEVIKDVEEQREMVEKEVSPFEREKGSAEFISSQRNYHGSLYATLAMKKKKRKNGKKEKVKHKHIGFETQIMSMNAMLLSGSDYTPSSHTRAYTPEREFNSIFRYMFPPALFGQKMAQVYLRGYRGERKI